MTEMNEKQVAALKPPAPTQQQTDEDCCEAELKVIACCRGSTLKTRTILYNAGAQTGISAAAQALAQVNALEANGWLVLAHSVIESLAQGGQVAGQRHVLITLGYYV